MRKINGSRRFFTFASMLLRRCMVVVTIGSIINHTSASPPTVKSVTPNVECASSPVWFSDSMYFIDVTMKGIFKYNPAGKGEFVSTKIGSVQGIASFLVPVSVDGSNETMFGLAVVDKICVFPWDGKPAEDLTVAYSWLMELGPTELITCGRVDSSGRLWVGTSYGVSEAEDGGFIRRGRMYLFNKDGTSQNKIEDICESYGIAWNPACDQMYFVDGSKSQIVANTFKSDPGDIVNDGKVVFDFIAKNVTCDPNALTVDADGNLWIACVNTNCIMKIDIKTSTLAMQVDIPEATSISSLVFGGPTLEDLYVTSCSNSSMFLVTNTGSKGIGSKAVNAVPPPPSP